VAALMLISDNLTRNHIIRYHKNTVLLKISIIFAFVLVNLLNGSQQFVILVVSRQCPQALWKITPLN
jgi:hypothetical protein